MLERMYARYCDASATHGRKLDGVAGEVAGIKSASLRFSGSYATGTAHRDGGAPPGAQIAVRLDAAPAPPLREVFVYPRSDENIEVEINPADCASTLPRDGRRGQHVNKPIRGAHHSVCPAASWS